MREDLPAGVLDMLRVPGLRTERIRKLHKELGIASITDLADAARSGSLAATKGYGAAFQGLRSCRASISAAGRRAAISIAQPPRFVLLPRRWRASIPTGPI